MILVSGNIRFSRGFLLAGASNESGVVKFGNFWPFEWLLLPFFGIFRDKASNDDMLTLVGRQMTRPTKSMPLNDHDWLFHAKIRCRPAFFESERLDVTK